MGFNCFMAGRTASCREALGRRRNVSLWFLCAKMGCVLLCFSYLSKPNFVEVGTAEISKEPCLYTILDFKLVLVAYTVGVTGFGVSHQ